MRNARRTALLCGACLVVAGCSSEPEATAPTLELSTTTFTTLAPTTVTTEAPTTTEDPRIAEVEAAVAAFHEVQLDLLLDSSVPLANLIDVASGELLTTTTDNVAMARADGRTFVGEFSLAPVSTTFDDGTTTHVACVFDEVAVIGADGSTIVEADQAPVLLEYALQRFEGVWLPVSLDFSSGSEVPCDV